MVEAGRVASGATGYTSAKVTVVHGLIYDTLCAAYGDDTARRYADANVAGMAAIVDLVDRHGIGCDLQRRPAFTYTCDPEMVDTVTAEVAAAQRIGLAAEFTTDTDLPYPVEGAIVVADQAQFHPRKFCSALAELVAGDGSHLYERTRATSIDYGDRRRVTTDGGVITADWVILASQLPFVDQGAFFARSHPARSTP